MSLGLCPHNNYRTYCPSCLGGKMPNQLGAYELIPGTGIMVPDIGELAAGASTGAVSTAGQTIASSSTVQQGAITAAGNTLGQKIVKFYTEKPVVAIGATLAVGGLILFGLMNLGKKKG